MLSAIGWLRNAIDYPVRQLVRLRRGAPALPAEPKAGLFSPAVAGEVERLVDAYDLADWRRESGRTDFAASLFYLQMLERAFQEAGVRLPAQVTALDAGCGDWFYVQPLYGLLRSYGLEGPPPRQVRLDGVELDAWALYEGFRSRCDWAQAFAAGLTGATYRPGDLRRYTAPVDLAFMLFPFLFPDDLREWGLPKRYLQPLAYLRHVWSLVKPGGWLVIANLGEAERSRQHQLLAEAGIPIHWWGEHRSPLYAYEEERAITVARKG